jgi:hypothetical protein
MRKYLFSFILLIIVLISGCSFDFSEDGCLTEKENDSNQWISENKSENPHHFDIFIDSSFSSEHIRQLQKSIIKWEDVLQGAFTYTIFTVEHGDLNSNQEKNKIKIINQLPPEGSIGYCWWQNASAKGITVSAVIHISNDLGPYNLFDVVSLHEMGHALNLDHYTGKLPSIMKPSSGPHDSPTINCIDKASVCEMWECEVKC